MCLILKRWKKLVKAFRTMDGLNHNAIKELLKSFLCALSRIRSVVTQQPFHNTYKSPKHMQIPKQIPNFQNQKQIQNQKTCKPKNPCKSNDTCKIRKLANSKTQSKIKKTFKIKNPANPKTLLNPKAFSNHMETSQQKCSRTLGEGMSQI